MLDIPEEMKQFVNDYKILLVEARENNLQLHNINNRDLFSLLEILLDRRRPINETRNRAIDYAKEHEVDKSVVMTVAGAANCKIDYNAFQKGDGGMCSLFEKIAKDNELKGRAVEIVETGYEFGLSEADILKRLQQKLDISIQVAQEYLKMFGKQTV